jgi:hypothetical protein
MDPVVEGRQCVEGPAPPLPWPWSGTRSLAVNFAKLAELLRKPDPCAE